MNSDQPAPVVEELSAYVQSGRVASSAAAIGDAETAEQLGFHRVFLSERYDLKEAGAILGGIGARTTRLGFGTGALAGGSRHPLMTAALGATLHSAYGPRFVLGLGRGPGEGYMRKTGMRFLSYRQYIDYAGIVKRLWAGETISYDGPLGRYDGIALNDPYPGPAPEIWAMGFGGPRMCQASADPVFDGVILAQCLTPEAVRESVEWIRAACERIDRDPATLRICQPLVTAPEIDDDEMRALLHARMVTYLQDPQVGDVYVNRNRWDPSPLQAVRDHHLFRGLSDQTGDQAYHRHQLLEPAKLVPDEWMTQTCAVGSAESCVRKLQEFFDAGVDEIATYGSSPAQNAPLIRAWRAAQTATTTA